MVGQEILVLFIMVRIRAPQPNKKHPTGVFFIRYSHGLCKYVSHLHRKTLLMFCNHFGKSQISQNGNGGTPPFPRVRPNQIKNTPTGVFFIRYSHGLRFRFAKYIIIDNNTPHRSHRLGVRTSDSHSENTGSIPVGTAKNYYKVQLL